MSSDNHLIWLSLAVVAGIVTATTCAQDEICRRMKLAREALGLTQEGLAQAVGGSKRGIQGNEALKQVPGGMVICGLVRLGINANWLLTGEGPMLLNDLAPPDDPELSALLARYAHCNEAERRAVNALLAAINEPGFKAWLKVGEYITDIANVFDKKR